MNQSQADLNLRTSPTLFLAMQSDDPVRRRAAQDRFFRAYAPIISRFVRRYGVKAGDVDDLVQTVVVAILSAKGFTLDPERGRFRGYLKAASINAVKKLWAKQSREGTTEIDGDSVGVEATWRDFWEEEMLKNALSEVRAAYSTQKAPTFEAFWRVAMLGQEVKVVADELKISVDSVYAAKSRIQNALKEQLQSLNDGLI